METGSTSIKFFIDEPKAWSPLSPCLVLRGWCFGAKGEPVRGIRLQVAGCVYHGATGRPRPDVKAAFPEAPDDCTGFEIRAPLPAGTHELTVAALLPDGIWHACLTRSITVQRPWRPRWLGGGTLTELIAFLMRVHPPRPVQPEKFPAVASAPRPRLSIVTPSYNQARFLGETLRSVLEQNAAVDYVVQDGGSTDASAEIIRRFAEQGERRMEKNAAGNRPPASLPPSPSSLLPSPVSPRLITWESAPDQGQADAIMRAFAKTKGGADDLMAWINSDDFYLPGTLAFVADYFARHPDVDVLYGHRILVDEQSSEIGRWFLPKHDPEVLCLNDFVPQETLFWRRRIWDKAGGIDPAFKFAMDWDLLLRFHAAGARIVRVPYFLACFRIHAAQKTSAAMHTVGQKEIDRLRARSQGREIPPAELERDPRLIRYLRRSAFMEFLWGWGIRAP